MAMEEVHDLKMLKLDHFVRKLVTCEIYFHEESEEQAPQQGLALKSSNIELQLKESDEHESLAILAKGSKKMFQKHVEFKRILKGSSSTKNE